MKKYTTYVLVLLLAVLFLGCNKESEEDEFLRRQVACNLSALLNKYDQA